MKLKIDRLLLAALAAIIILPGCGSETDDSLTYTVTKGNFKNALAVEGEVESLHSTAILCPENIGGPISFLIEDGTWVEKGDTLCILDVGNTHQYRIELLTEIEKQESELATTIAKNNMEMADMESQFKANEADTRIAQLDSLQLLYMAPGPRKIQELELKKVALEKRSFDERLKALPIIQKANVQGIERNIAKLKETLDMIDGLIASTAILAPQKGLAIRAMSPNSRWNKLKEGTSVWYGIAVVMMPDMDSFKVKIMVPETEFKHINQGDSVIYSFPAMPGESAYGTVTKKVMAGVPISNSSKIKMFEIEASMDSTTRKPEPGLSVDCEILLQEQKDVVFIPQVALFQDDSIKFVYVKDKTVYEKRQVETGLSSQTQIIITVGLQEGEQVAYLAPKPSLVKRTTLFTAPEEVPEGQGDVPGADATAEEGRSAGDETITPDGGAGEVQPEMEQIQK